MSLPPPAPGSIALVTGASSGMGEQFARALSARGHRVALVARTVNRLAALAEELGGPERAIALSADLAVADERERAAMQLEELGAEVEVLINNAGFGVYRSFVDSGPGLELRQVHVLVEAPVDLMARYLPRMVKRGRGAVINMSSTAGLQPLPFNAGYSAAKAYILQLSEAVHVEVKPSGVTVTAVCPGPVATGFQEASDASYFAERLPSVAFVSPERVVREALEAADRGRMSVIPGGPHMRLAFAPNRRLPRWLVMPVAKRMMQRR